MAYINLFMHVSSEKCVPEGAVAQINVDEHKMLCDEIERLREALQHIRSLATPPVRQIRLRSILEQCVWFVNAALKEGE